MQRRPSGRVASFVSGCLVSSVHFVRRWTEWTRWTMVDTAQAILDKYKDQEFPYGRALPVLANQLMNRYLKNLCELAGFNKPITRTCYRAGQRVEETYPKYEMIGTHAGRRTFICFALSSGIPPQVVMKWTGHSDYQTMKPYIAIAEKTKADAMKLFDEELKK